MKDALRILMICPQFKPIVGGYERAAERLSVELVRQGNLVTVVSERRVKAWPRKETIAGVVVRRLWCLHRPRRHMVTSLISFTWFLLMRGRRFQIWHVHQYGFHAILAIILGRVLRRPVVLKLTSSGSQSLEKVISTLPMVRYTVSVFRNVDSIIALTRETLDETTKFGIPRSRIHVLGNGVDAQRFRPRCEKERMQIRKRLGIDAIGFVLFVGRLSEEKNPLGLLHSWRLALPNMPEGWRLVLVGGGSLYHRVESVVKAERLKDSVLLAGHQDNIDAWMAAADIYVLPSHWEGLSNTMLEAMASGLPVVSTRVSGSTETIDETGAGLVVNVGAMDQLAEALIQLASDEKMRLEMGKAGRSIIEDRYSISSVAGRHLLLYQSLLSTSSDSVGSI